MIHIFLLFTWLVPRGLLVLEVINDYMFHGLSRVGLRKVVESFAVVCSCYEFLVDQSLNCLFI